MAYYNPQPNLMQQLFPSHMTPPLSMSPPSQQPKVNPQQFASVAATLDDNSLNQLIAMARQRGISDADIQAGINVINQFRQR